MDNKDILESEKGISQGIGQLYLCATPIGNLEDITFRVLRILKEVDVIAAEDTRNSIKLLNHFEINTPMTSYHEYNKYDKAKTLVEKMLKGENVAVITDAGTPGISDPGEELVRQALEAGIKVSSVPGAAACITALTMSGQATRRFAFEAFLPSDKNERKDILSELESETRTMIIYEAPHKIVTTLNDIYKYLGDVNIVLARELTKIHESFIRGKISEIISQMKEIKGEMIILIEGNKNIEENETQNNLPIEEQYELYKKQGLTKNEAIKKIAKEQGVSKNEIYMQFLNKE